MTILVIEDDQDIREAVAEILESSGYEVLQASNGRSALETLHNADTLPSVILLDLMMPVMNGWQFREAQRQEPRFSHIPVVILTARPDAAAVASELAAARWLKKPVEIDALLGAISLQS